MYARILVPVDGSESAKQALKVACKLLDREGSTLYLLHVPETLAYTTTLVWGIGAIDAGTTLAEREKVGEQLLAQAVSSAQAEGAKHIEELLTQGDPARIIIEAANANNSQVSCDYGESIKSNVDICPTSPDMVFNLNKFTCRLTHPSPCF